MAVAEQEHAPDTTMLSDAELEAWLNPPGDALDKMLRERAELKFRNERIREVQELRKRRQEATKVERLCLLQAELRGISHAVVLPIGRSAASANADPNLVADTGIGDLTVGRTEQYLSDLNSPESRIQHRAMLMLEAAVDVHHGRHKLFHAQTKSEREKRIIEDFVGIPVDLCVQLEPSLGTKKMIREVREKAGRDPETGGELA
jgi:hypothetical protein